MVDFLAAQWFPIALMVTGVITGWLFNHFTIRRRRHLTGDVPSRVTDKSAAAPPAPPPESPRPSRRAHEDGGRGDRSAPRPTDTEAEWWMAPLGLFVGLVVTVAVYLTYRVVVYQVLIGLAAFLFGFWLTVVVAIARQRAYVPLHWGAWLLTTLALLPLALANTSMLQSRQGSWGRFLGLLEVFDASGMGAVIDRYGLDGVLFVGYQVVGVLAYVAAFLLVAMALTHIFVSLASEARPASRAWRRLVGHTERLRFDAGWRCAAAVLAGSLSILLTSGLAFNNVVEPLRQRNTEQMERLLDGGSTNVDDPPPESTAAPGLAVAYR